MAASRRIAILTPTLRISLLAFAGWLAVVVPALIYLTWHAGFVARLAAGLVFWGSEPMIGGPPEWPGGLLHALPTVLLSSAGAYLAAGGMIRATELGGDRTLRIALSALLAVLAIGYAGMLSLAMGRLDAWTVQAWSGAAAAVMAGSWFAARNHQRPPPPIRPSPGSSSRPLRCVGATLVACSVGLSLVHAWMSPVTEWDATIYHAAAAKIWFLERPAPPLLHGPSVGIEISANYPPLFPAGGAAVDVLSGSLQDLYLRLLSPLALGILLLLVFVYARWIYGPRTGWWAVILTAGCPLLAAYGNWTTAYVLFAAAMVAITLLCHLAATGRSLAVWAAAGALAGLVALLQPFGLLSPLIALLAAGIWTRSRRGALGLALFGAVLVAMASPWWLRNLVLLHDPVYPLGSPVFQGIGLTQPMWAASQAEIVGGALTNRSGTGIALRLDEIGTMLGDPQLLAAGGLFPLVWGLLAARRGDLAAGFLAAVATALFCVQLAIGWFFLRSLLPAVPLLAILAARGILTAYLDPGRGHPFQWPKAWPRQQGAATAWLVLGCSLVMAFCVPLAGPYEEDWGSGGLHALGPAAPLAALGSRDQNLWNAFRGDYQAWRLLSTRLRPGERVATFEIRSYWFGSPDQLFYLDGSEGDPLLRMEDPAEVVAYLQEQRVRYVLIPGWSRSSLMNRHRGLDLLPLSKMLGGERFRLLQAFAPSSADAPTLLYGIDIPAGPIPAGVFTGLGTAVPALDAVRYRFPPNRRDGLIYVPTMPGAVSELAFQTTAPRPTRISVREVLSGSGPGAHSPPELASFVARPDVGTARFRFTSNGRPGRILELVVGGQPLTLSDLTVSIT